MRKSKLNLSPQQALYILGTLVDAGKLSAKRIREVLRKRDEMIRDAKHQLAELEGYGITRRRSRAPRAKVAARAEGAKSARRKPVLPPKVLAFRRKQGSYMGLVRQLDATGKTRVRVMREKHGIVAAIKLAKSLVAA